MERTSPRRARVRERRVERLRLLKRRIVAASVVGFGAVVGLSARHTLGVVHKSPRAPAVSARFTRPVPQAAFFDERDAGAYAFHDAAPAGSTPETSGAVDPPPGPPPVVQSSVS